MDDKITATILEDGTVSIKTEGEVSKENHISADQFFQFIEKGLGIVVSKKKERKPTIVRSKIEQKQPQ